MFRPSFAAMLIGAALGMSTKPFGAVPAMPKLHRRSGFVQDGSPTSEFWGYMKHGPSAAQLKRAAKKARNIRRHKAASKGRP